MLVEAAGRVSDGEAVGRDLGVGEHRGLRHMGCVVLTTMRRSADHRLKQHPKWKVDQLPDGTFRWTTPSGRSYDTEPTRYPV